MINVNIVNAAVWIAVAVLHIVRLVTQSTAVIGGIEIAPWLSAVAVAGGAVVTRDEGCVDGFAHQRHGQRGHHGDHGAEHAPEAGPTAGGLIRGPKLPISSFGPRRLSG